MKFLYSDHHQNWNEWYRKGVCHKRDTVHRSHLCWTDKRGSKYWHSLSSQWLLLQRVFHIYCFILQSSSERRGSVVWRLVLMMLWLPLKWRQLKPHSPRKPTRYCHYQVRLVISLQQTRAKVVPVATFFNQSRQFLPNATYLYFA